MSTGYDPAAAWDAYCWRTEHGHCSHCAVWCRFDEDHGYNRLCRHCAARQAEEDAIYKADCVCHECEEEFGPYGFCHCRDGKRRCYTCFSAYVDERAIAP